jgi:hypothetical protein
MGLEDFTGDSDESEEVERDKDDRDEILPHNKLEPTYNYEVESSGNAEEYKQYRLFCSNCDRVDEWRDNKDEVVRAIKLHSKLNDHAVVLHKRADLWD